MTTLIFATLVGFQKLVRSEVTEVNWCVGDPRGQKALDHPHAGIHVMHLLHVTIPERYLEIHANLNLGFKPKSGLPSLPHAILFLVVIGIDSCVSPVCNKS